MLCTAPSSVQEMPETGIGQNCSVTVSNNWGASDDSTRFHIATIRVTAEDSLAFQSLSVEARVAVTAKRARPKIVGRVKFGRLPGKPILMTASSLLLCVGQMLFNSSVTNESGAKNVVGVPKLP